MEILEKILKYKSNRKELIDDFQKIVWNNAEISNILSELAYDLDFYEPDEEWRKEDPSYYGDEELEVRVKSVIERLKEK